MLRASVTSNPYPTRRPSKRYNTLHTTVSWMSTLAFVSTMKLIPSRRIRSCTTVLTSGYTILFLSCFSQQSLHEVHDDLDPDRVILCQMNPTWLQSGK